MNQINSSELQKPEAEAVIDCLLQQIIGVSHFNLRYKILAPALHGRNLTVEFTGEDVPHLLARNAELLLALEHIAAKALRLEPEQHDQISFDAGNFKHQREHSLDRAAQTALRHVQTTRHAYHFPPMNSRERRLLHLALTPSGLHTASEGEGPSRHLVLHPEAPAQHLQAAFTAQPLPSARVLRPLPLSRPPR